MMKYLLDKLWINFATMGLKTPKSVENLNKTNEGTKQNQWVVALADKECSCRSMVCWSYNTWTME